MGTISGARPIKILSGAFLLFILKNTYFKSKRERKTFTCNYINKSFPTYGEISDVD